ncbi:MAG: hydrolase [Ruminococcus sp.]|nr:hydrolase [Ruminococcus sp.]
MIFYTADPHFGHERIITLCSRPFSSAEEMNEALISRWNSVVGEEDDIYVLGDVMYRSKTPPDKILSRLSGKKHLIVGNHDEDRLDDPDFTRFFESIDNYLIIDDEGRKVVLFHYPILEWYGSYRGYYHVFGHIHNMDNDAQRIMLPNRMAFNAGADIWDFTPVTLDQMIESKKSD